MIRRYAEQERIPNFDKLDTATRKAAVLKERKIDLGKAALGGKNAVRLLTRNYRKTAPYIHLTHTERVMLIRNLADLVGTWGDTVLFADAQQKAAHLAQSPDERILEYAFEQVVSRFHHYLDRIDTVPGIRARRR